MASSSSQVRDTSPVHSQNSSGSVAAFLYTVEETRFFDRVVFVAKKEFRFDPLHHDRGSVFSENKWIPGALLFQSQKLTPQQLEVGLDAKPDSPGRQFLIRMGKLRAEELQPDKAVAVSSGTSAKEKSNRARVPSYQTRSDEIPKNGSGGDMSSKRSLSVSRGRLPDSNYSSKIGKASVGSGSSGSRTNLNPNRIAEVGNNIEIDIDDDLIIPNFGLESLADDQQSEATSGSDDEEEAYVRIPALLRQYASDCITDLFWQEELLNHDFNFRGAKTSKQSLDAGRVNEAVARMERFAKEHPSVGQKSTKEIHFILSRAKIEYRVKQKRESMKAAPKHD